MNFFNQNLRVRTGLDNVLDLLSPVSEFGRIMSHGISPLTDVNKLTEEYDNIEKCLEIVCDKTIYCSFIEILMQFRDIHSTIIKCKNCLTLDECELFEIKSFAIISGRLVEMKRPELAGVTFYSFSDIVSLLDPNGAGTASFYIYDEYSAALAALRHCKAEIERSVYSATGDARRILFEKRTVITEKEKREELAVRENLTRSLCEYADRFAEMADSIARFDITLAKAKMAADYNMCRPVICNDFCVKIKNGFNPVIKDAVEKRGNQFCPVSIEAHKGVTVITGANMGGKTVALSVVALNCLMSSMGFFAFSKSFTFKPPDFISFLSDNTGSLENGLSTFGSDVSQLKDILERLKSGNGLVIIDEFARGTNPAEGSSLVKALVKYLGSRGSVSILSTHYDGVGKYAGSHYQIRGLKDADFSNFNSCSSTDYASFIADKMDYRLEKAENHDVPRDALCICSLFGVDREIVESAKAFLKNDFDRDKQAACKKEEGLHEQQNES